MHTQTTHRYCDQIPLMTGITASPVVVMENDDGFDLSKGQGICTSVHGADRGKAEYMVRAVQQISGAILELMSFK